MSRRLTSTVLALTALAPASWAFAFSFVPTAQPIIGSGRMSFAAAGFNLDCKAAFSGATDADGGARIDVMIFSGGMLGSCRGVHPMGLPWRVYATGPHRVVISSIHVDAPLVGECEDQKVPAVIDDSGVVHFGRIGLPPRCTITGGALSTRPNVKIIGS